MNCAGRLIHHILGVVLVCSRMARMFAARQLTAVMLSRMEGLVGNVDLDIFELPGEGLDLRDAWNVQQLRGCLGALAVARLLPAFSGFLLAFLQLCV